MASVTQQSALGYAPTGFTEEEAIRMANSSEYGLVAYVFSEGIEEYLETKYVGMAL